MPNGPGRLASIGLTEKLTAKRALVSKSSALAEAERAAKAAKEASERANVERLPALAETKKATKLANIKRMQALVEAERAVEMAAKFAHIERSQALRAQARKSAKKQRTGGK